MGRVAVLQMTSGIDPAANAATMVAAVGSAEMGGASMLFTPEMSGMLDRKRARAADKIVTEDRDPVLAAMCEAAAAAGIWVGIGSLAIKREDGRWANRSFVLDSSGNIAARYDKIHMFDVDLESGESWRESSAYAAGDSVVTVETPLGRLGLSVCYDIRFPALYDALGRAKCDVIAIPAAFTVPTGKDHWHVMQRARAIEASAYVIAAAQVGTHEDGRTTFGHSLIVDPWGKLMMDLDGKQASIGFAEVDRARIAEVRDQLPSLANRQDVAN